MTAEKDQDRLARIAVKLANVQHASRDNEVDVLNPAHHASWDDLEWLHTRLCSSIVECQTLRGENERLRALTEDADPRERRMLNRAGREQFDRAEEAEKQLTLLRGERDRLKAQLETQEQ